MTDDYTDEEMQEIWEEFISTMVSGTKPLDPEYAEVINEYFWDLLMK